MSGNEKGSTGAARGFVCAKHEAFCPDGVCRWCEPPAPVKTETPLTFMGVPIAVDPDLPPGGWRFVPPAPPAFACAGHPGSHVDMTFLCANMSPLIDGTNRGHICCRPKGHSGVHGHHGGREWAEDVAAGGPQ